MSSHGKDIDIKQHFKGTSSESEPQAPEYACFAASEAADAALRTIVPRPIPKPLFEIKIGEKGPKSSLLWSEMGNDK